MIQHTDSSGAVLFNLTEVNGYELMLRLACSEEMFKATTLDKYLCTVVG